MQDKVRTVSTEKLAEEIKLLLSGNHSVTITARGNSMNPVFRDRRDKVIISPIKDKPLKRGDVIFTVTRDGRYVIHRIIKTDRENITLLGDGNIAITENAAVKDTIGLVTGYIRNEKERSCRSMRWKIYSLVWMALKPVRKYALGIWRRINR